MNAFGARPSVDHAAVLAAVLEEIERYKQNLPTLLKELDRDDFELDSKRLASVQTMQHA